MSRGSQFSSSRVSTSLFQAPWACGSARRVCTSLGKYHGPSFPWKVLKTLSVSLLTTFPQSYRTHQHTALSHTPSLIHSLTDTQIHSHALIRTHTHLCSHNYNLTFSHSPLTSTNTKHPHSQTPLHSCTLLHSSCTQQYPCAHNHIFKH